MSRGGARPGSGRPRVTLVALIEEGRFDSSSKRHCRLLLLEDLPAGADEELRRLQESFRHFSVMRGFTADLARSFARRVEELRS